MTSAGPRCLLGAQEIPNKRSSSSSTSASTTAEATLGVKEPAGDYHDQDPAAGRRWQQLWSPSASR
jgi:hypothetical protein